MSKTMKRLFLFLLLVTIIGIISTIFINIYMINSTKNQIIKIDKLSDNLEVDAILILGCKAYEDRPSLMLAKRLERGIDIYNKLHTKILLSGDHGRKEYDEVDVMTDYIIDSKISSNDIFQDHAGFNTYDSIYRAKYIFDIKKMIIVTQEYHMYRALYLANKLEIDAIGVVADDIPQKGVMLKNEIREILSRDKNFFKGIIKPKSKYLGEKISIKGVSNVELNK